MPTPIYYSRKAVNKFLSTRFPKINWTPITDELPLIIWRSKWNELAKKYDLPYTKNYITELDLKGMGPKAYNRWGIYNRSNF